MIISVWFTDSQVEIKFNDTGSEHFKKADPNSVKNGSNSCLVALVNYCFPPNVTNFKVNFSWVIRPSILLSSKTIKTKTIYNADKTSKY